MINRYIKGSANDEIIAHHYLPYVLAVLKWVDLFHTSISISDSIICGLDESQLVRLAPQREASTRWSLVQSVFGQKTCMSGKQVARATPNLLSMGSKVSSLLRTFWDILYPQARNVSLFLAWQILIFAWVLSRLQFSSIATFDTD